MPRDIGKLAATVRRAASPAVRRNCEATHQQHGTELGPGPQGPRAPAPLRLRGGRGRGRRHGEGAPDGAVAAGVRRRGGGAAAAAAKSTEPAPQMQLAPEPVLDSDDDVGPIENDALRTRRGLQPAPKPDAPVKPQASWDAESFFREEQRRDRENFERKQKVFDRVLATLGGNQGTENVPRDVLEAFKRSREKEEDRLFEQEEAIRERAEARRLQAQRETLRRRFEKGSPDAVGLDPLAVKKPKEATETREELAKAAAAMMPRKGGSINYDPAGLDKILDGIEREHGNIEDGPISAELSELFALMDAAPKSKKKAAAAPPPPTGTTASLLYRRPSASRRRRARPGEPRDARRPVSAESRLRRARGLGTDRTTTTTEGAGGRETGGAGLRPMPPTHAHAARTIIQSATTRCGDASMPVSELHEQAPVGRRLLRSRRVVHEVDAHHPSASAWRRILTSWCSAVDVPSNQTRAGRGVAHVDLPLVVATVLAPFALHGHVRRPQCCDDLDLRRGRDGLSLGPFSHLPIPREAAFFYDHVPREIRSRTREVEGIFRPLPLDGGPPASGRFGAQAGHGIWPHGPAVSRNLP